MNILCIGDVVGRPGRHAVGKLLAGLKKEFNIDLVIANVENAAGGMGLTPSIPRRISQNLSACSAPKKSS